jgi:predicted nucleic acid-binding protein
MTVVADSCPLIFIAAVSQFALLRLYFSCILVPSAVYQ